MEKLCPSNKVRFRHLYDKTDKEDLKSATPFPKCYLHKEKWTFDS